MSYSGLQFVSHGNHHWKIATHYTMFAALVSVHDNKQNKVIEVTVHCTVTVFSLSVMVIARVGLFSLAKKSLTGRDPSAVFNSLCLPAIPKNLFSFYFDGTI